MDKAQILSSNPKTHIQVPSVTRGTPVFTDARGATAKKKLRNAKLIQVPSDTRGTPTGIVSQSVSAAVSGTHNSEDTHYSEMQYNKNTPDSVKENDLNINEQLVPQRTGNDYQMCLVRYPGLSAVCHLDHLPNNVLNGELSIEILDLSSLLLKNQFALNHGLLFPSQIYAHILEGSSLNEADCVPSFCTAVQMHFVPGHYILSYQFMKTITIYDSSPAAGRKEQILPQLKLMYKVLTENPETPIYYCTPQRQPDSESCGMFVIAFAVALLLKQNPLTKTNFLTSGIRGHLLRCLKEGTFTMFPTIPDAMQCLQNYLRAQAEYQDKYTKCKEKNEKLSMAEKGSKKSLDSKARKAKQRKAMTDEQQEQERAKKRIGMKRHRNTMTDKQQEQERVKRRRGMERHRDTMTDKQQEQERVKRRRGMERHRDTMTDKQQEQERTKQRRGMERHRDTMTDKQQEQERTKQRRGMERHRDTMTDKQQEQERVKRRRGMERHRDKMTDKQQEQERTKQRRGMKRHRDTMTDKQQEQERAKRRRGMDRHRDTMTDKQQEQERAKRREGKKHLRKSSNIEEALRTFNQHII